MAAWKPVNQPVHVDYINMQNRCQQETGQNGTRAIRYIDIDSAEPLFQIQELITYNTLIVFLIR